MAKPQMEEGPALRPIGPTGGMQRGDVVTVALFHPERLSVAPDRELAKEGMMITNILRLVGQRFPLLVFGVPGITSLLAGLVSGAQVVGAWRRVHALHVGTALISVSLCIAGTMAVFAAIVLSMVRELRSAMRGAGGGASGTPYTSNWVSLSKDLDWPLVFFGLPGTLVLLAGIACGVWVVDACNRSHVLSVGYAIISASLCIAGEMTWLTGIVLHTLRELVLDVAGS
jgi:hypothetical protein